MKPFHTALSFLFLTAALGIQAQIMRATEPKEDLKAEQGPELQMFHLGFQDSSDCCFSYASRIQCSRFIYYFPTSSGCINPGIIFVSQRGNQVCANPSDRRVQRCIQRLEQNSQPQTYKQ
ncbi:C-C motif chemokine 9-like [Mastomys coucha]|uniref:C-C motif chemokine 9-like n=1 Tax=Mastomys coucha TaxID=35658 RepID=UPI0012619397|nr:C-C motif chemokine 9-like [Mastomys coucha]